MTRVNIELEMHDYFMAIMSHYNWKCDFRTFVLTCGRLLNFLESASHFYDKMEKAYAAEFLLEQFNIGVNGSISGDCITKLKDVMVLDTELLPDEHTFAIDEIYELGHGLKIRSIANGD